MHEQLRRNISAVLMWAGWLSSATLATLRVNDAVPTTWGSIIVLTVGVAIAASLVRSRYRLQDTVASALKAGMEISSIHEHHRTVISGHECECSTTVGDRDPKGSTASET